MAHGAVESVDGVCGAGQAGFHEDGGQHGQSYVDGDEDVKESQPVAAEFVDEFVDADDHGALPAGYGCFWGGSCHVVLAAV